MLGHMQYQLEHHLFPSMPRYNLPKVVPQVKAFAKANGLEYKETPMVEIYLMYATWHSRLSTLTVCRYINTLKKFSNVPAIDL